MELRSESFAVAKKNDLNNSKLKDYSPWLSNFQSWIYPTQIEIPGLCNVRKKIYISFSFTSSILFNWKEDDLFCYFCLIVNLGQYTGRSKPLPEYHVKISGFDEKVRVLYKHSHVRLPA